MDLETYLDALRLTPGVRSARPRGAFIFVVCESASRASGLAETIAEAGPHVHRKGAELAFRPTQLL